MSNVMRSAALWLALGSRSQLLLTPVRPSLSASRRRPVTSASASTTSSEASTWPRGPNPSPYEVLGVSRSAPYSKVRFYQLVKLYHPDSSQPSSALPPSVRLDRYRLVIAANDLLSDPAKRRLYDTHGIGWAPSSQTRSQPSDSPHGREHNSTWRNRPGSAANNASWEDWEAWHEARRRQKQQSSNPNATMGIIGTELEFGFVLLSLVCIFAVFDFFRTGKSSGALADRAQKQTAAIKEDVRRSTEATAERTMAESVDHFLKYRQNDWHLPGADLKSASIHFWAGRLPQGLTMTGPHTVMAMICPYDHLLASKLLWLKTLTRDIM
ncbi:hypothetical protein L249_0038 [Ophiocordyceps polyrhachis-furcata BCC 54312]|uniref:J domain-containing protein n=1 Tax=Ophiocordyceps polyrhachis-furcata BCC 54312 TaxID=1330021 RepID=A0A367LFD9_9HYPO|nr:hypothetical protein L249_0038 [Ophiocordyceps polyrhachis-furcata BCC 54312]